MTPPVWPKILSLIFFSAAGAIILKIAYGYDVLEEHDPFIELAEKAMHTLMDAMIPGAFWVVCSTLFENGRYSY